MELLLLCPGVPDDTSPGYDKRIKLVPLLKALRKKRMAFIDRHLPINRGGINVLKQVIILERVMMCG